MSINQTPKELNDLGDKYFYGLDTVKNIELAFTYYKKAADLNNPVGYFNVGKYFIEKEEYKEAIEYLLKAKDLRYTEAMVKLSEMYLNGLGYRKNKKKAFKMLQNAVNASDVFAFHKLGVFYLKGIGCKKDELKARDLFERSAKSKVARGMYHLGWLYLNAKKIKKDYENGFFWLDKAAEKADLEAINYLIELYHNSHPYLKKKSLLYLQEMEFYYTELLAKTMNEEALIKVGFAYYEGNEFTKINYEKANGYFNDLLKMDNTMGYLGLGLSYLYGRGVEEDYIKAKEYLLIAQTRGNHKAMNALGEIYRLGYGVEINYQRAKDYYFEAAKNNETDALINLGLLHYRNQIQGASKKMAFQYMIAANEKGNQLAHYWLGIFYEKGIGVKPDLKLAISEFEKAIEFGNEGAKYKYAQLLYETVDNKKMSSKKKNSIYIQIKDLLVEYINSVNTSEINKIYSMYMLGNLFKEESFSLKSDKISRYYYELAASKNHAKAMVRMFFILKDKEPKQALNYLEEACKQPQDGESLFVMGCLYLEGFDSIEKDLEKARKYLSLASKLNYMPAKEKLIMI
ncbi:MAG: hypothetical protein B6I17_00345 [Tenericutes bacterium 4572_104]|nr:MAG: hypothetical protein B6I17_00345 [Tenericutes bacterium 4572_104]